MQEGSDSSLQRVLQDIRKNPVVESEHAHTAPLKNQLRLNLPGKENFTPNIERSETASPFSLSVGSLEPQPHHVSSAASSNECGNDHSTEHHINEHTGKGFAIYLYQEHMSFWDWHAPECTLYWWL